MFNYINNYKKLFDGSVNHFLAISILSIYPLFFFIGTAFVNSSILFLDVVFLIEIFKKKRFDVFKNYIFYSLIIIWFILLINLVFSLDPFNSFGRSFGFLRYIIFVMLILYYFRINGQKYQKIILTSWLIIFLIVSFDLIFEIFNGKNILGFESYMPGRLAGFYNDELKIGHFYYAFILIALTHFFNLFSKKKILLLGKDLNLKIIFYFLISLFLVIALMIGERSNFIKILIMILFFSFFFERKFYKIKIVAFSVLFIIIISIINFNENYKGRFINQMIKPIFDNPVNYIANHNYGKHYMTGLEVFQNNKIFGVGLKNYRIEVKNWKYDKASPETGRNLTILDASIHPHQLHFEILSELGIIGYIAFAIFFIFHFTKYFKNKKDINLHWAGFLFVCTSLLPLLPSGSFFTSHGAAMFWMNFAFMNLSQKNLNFEFHKIR